MESLSRLISAAEGSNGTTNDEVSKQPSRHEEFTGLSEMMDMEELEIVRRRGGRVHRSNEVDGAQMHNEDPNWNKARVVIDDAISPDGSTRPESWIGGRLKGIYENYLLVRPHPSLRILFASPSLRVPGILQSKFMDRIGGSQRVHDELTNALAGSRGVTARIRWISRHDPQGRSRWIHCTPLLGSNGSIGVWMIVIVDEDGALVKSYRRAPPVDAHPRAAEAVTRRRGNSESTRNSAVPSEDWGVRDAMLADNQVVGERRGSISTASGAGSAYTMRI